MIKAFLALLILSTHFRDTFDPLAYMVYYLVIEGISFTEFWFQLLTEYADQSTYMPEIFGFLILTRLISAHPFARARSLKSFGKDF